MADLIALFSSDSFMPHGHCFLWRPDILWLSVGADIGIALAYFTIPVALIHLVHKRYDLEFNWIFVMFALFILACGATHVMDVITIWNPLYGTQGLIKLFTAAVSLVTAVMLWRLMPVLLKLPSTNELQQKEKSLEVLNEQLRHASKSTLNQVIESAPNGLLMVDQDGKIVLCNAQIELLFGYCRADLLFQKIEILVPERFSQMHPAHRAGYFGNPETRQMGAGRELTGLHKNGTEFPVEIGLNPIQTKDGQFVLASIVDITERKKVATDLAQAKQSAEEASFAKSSFLANMSHEIRTPLGAVLGFAELVVDPKIQPAEKAIFISAIKRNGELLSNIINDILDLSKIEAGKMQVVTQDVALSEVLTDTKTLLDLLASEKGIALSVSIEASVPEIINTDPLRLRQILINIIGNAIKFTSKGTVRVNVQKDLPEHGSNFLRFVIKDTGRGIGVDQVDKLFAPFSQADVTSKRNHGGTGLGLVLSKRFARLLGGDVVLTETQLGKGSTFTVMIDPGPVRSHKFKVSEEEAPVDGFQGEELRLKGIRILLAEDSSDNQILVSSLLKLAGATVEIVSNGREAIEKIKLNPYDILLMDLQMPVMDGFEATKELRKDGYLGKIVALTAHTLSDSREHCLQNGFDEHIGKPVKRDVLIEIIERSTRKGRMT